MTVRPGTRFDEDAAIEVWRACLGVRGRLPSAARIAQVRRKLRAPDALHLVAEDDGRVVGMLLAELSTEEAGVLHLSMLFVHPDRWRRGIGTSLLTALTSRYPRVSTWTAADDEPALGAYARSGFARTGRVQDDLVQLAKSPAAQDVPP